MEIVDSKSYREIFQVFEASNIIRMLSIPTLNLYEVQLSLLLSIFVSCLSHTYIILTLHHLSNSCKPKSNRFFFYFN